MATWDQTARTATLDQFRKGVVSLLVASDVAARGLDIPVPGLTTKRARMCAIPRRTVKRPIMASAPMISAQRSGDMAAYYKRQAHDLNSELTLESRAPSIEHFGSIAQYQKEGGLRHIRPRGFGVI